MLSIEDIQPGANGSPTRTRACATPIVDAGDDEEILLSPQSEGLQDLVVAA